MESSGLQTVEREVNDTMAARQGAAGGIHCKVRDLEQFGIWEKHLFELPTLMCWVSHLTL